MAIFDDLFDFLKPLSEAVGDIKEGVTDVLGDTGTSILGAAVRGIGSTRETAKERAATASKSLKDYSIGGTTNVEPGVVGYGVKNYSSDPADMERYWQSILTQFITPNATKGGK